jgi:hypothetical protein
LTLSEQQRVSRFEAVNFFSLNIHGEKALMAGLAQRLYVPDCREASRYLHHFLEEENRHMAAFASYCLACAGHIYPDRKLAVPRVLAEGEEDFLFFTRVLIFEEIVDVYNRRMARDPRLTPAARSINRMHHADESRHLAFGRKMVTRLFERYRPRWEPEMIVSVREALASYAQMAWKEYYNPSAWRDAGLVDAYALRDLAWQDPHQRRHRREISSGWIRFLLGQGVLEEEPAL